MGHEDLSVIDVRVVTIRIPEVLTYFLTPRRSISLAMQLAAPVMRSS